MRLLGAEGQLGDDFEWAMRAAEEGAVLCDTLPPEWFTGVLLEKHPGVACRSFAGVVVWLLGDEAQALVVADSVEALELALAAARSTGARALEGRVADTLARR